MIKDILKTLSDTELTTVAYELNNPKISNKQIFKQLVAKSNGETIAFTKWSKGYLKSSTEELVCEVAFELANRLLERDKSNTFKTLP